MHLFTLFQKENYVDDKKRFEIGLKIYELYVQWMRAEIDSLVKSGNMKYGMVISPDSYLELCHEKYGRIGYQLALQLLTKLTIVVNLEEQ